MGRQTEQTGVTRALVRVTHVTLCLAPVRRAHINEFGGYLRCEGITRNNA